MSNATLIVLWLGTAGLALVYWWLVRETAERWSQMQRRKGRSTDHPVEPRAMQVLAFVWSGQSKAFGDAKLTRLVWLTRLGLLAVILALAGVVASLFTASR